MSKLDIVVFGASGFTGKYVVECLLRLCDKYPYSDISWGIAGRSKDKLQELINEVSQSGTTCHIPTIIADIKDEQSLRSMVQSARVLMNCTGPYTVLGEPVVKACVENGTHYVDMTAELHFMLQTYKSYHKAAEEANVLVVTACGFGSLPAVIGMVHLEKQFKGTLNSVDCYTQLQIPRRALFPCGDNTLVHYGTWASMVHEFQNRRTYLQMKNEVYPQDVYEPVDAKSKRGFLHRNHGKFWFPYPGPDKDIIDFTERYLLEKRGKKPVPINVYTTTPWFIHLILLIPVFMIYYYASFMGCFRKLLWKFPRFFTLGYISHGGPSKRIMEEMKFHFTLTGKGTEVLGSGENEKVVERTASVKVSGVDPYSVTALAFVMSAITIVKEPSKMPRGGVLSSGAAFYDTNIVDRLNSNGLLYETLPGKLVQ